MPAGRWAWCVIPLAVLATALEPGLGSGSKLVAGVEQPGPGSSTAVPTTTANHTTTSPAGHRMSDATIAVLAFVGVVAMTGCLSACMVIAQKYRSQPSHSYRPVGTDADVQMLMDDDDADDDDDEQVVFTKGSRPGGDDGLGYAGDDLFEA